MKTDDKIKNILPVSIIREMESAYLNYSMSVITSRALPDCRDGLKPVHRRILYAMYMAHNFYNKPYKKSARVVGEVMGLYHPHGDSAIYAALVRMAQIFSLNAVLVDGQGNFGSIDGDSAAQMRYTEVRLSKITHSMLEDIDKNTVIFQNTYDNSGQEPLVLPARYPNLLVNGASGIAVGMATSIPTHNLGEVISATCALIDDPNITDLMLLKILPAPDFPTGAEIINAMNTKKALLSGRGTIILRSTLHIEEQEGRKSVIITEIPYQVNKSEMLKSIENLMRNKILDGISEIRDETNKLGIRIILELKRDVQEAAILNQLYKNTPVQSNFNVNMLSLHNKSPKLMGVREVLTFFIAFRLQIIKKRVKFLLSQARSQAHHLIGLAIAVVNINEIILLIKNTANTAQAKVAIIERPWPAVNIVKFLRLIDDHRNKVINNFCHLTEDQVQSILEMKLHKLTVLEYNKINDELNSLVSLIQDYLHTLSNEKRVFAIMKNELLNIQNKIITPRKTKIKELRLSVEDEDMIPKEDMVVTLTESGFIKRVPLNIYKSQKRGGRGKSAMSILNNDILTNLLVTNIHTSLLFFSKQGLVYKLKAYKIPVVSNQSRGRALVNFLPIKKSDKITRIIAMPENKHSWIDFNIIFATQNGSARRNKLTDFSNIQSDGKIAMKLKKHDRLIDVNFCSDDNHVLLATKMGKAVRFSLDVLRVFKSRSSSGVKAVKLANSNDQVIAMSILKSGELDTLQRDEYLKIPLKQRTKIAYSQCEQRTSDIAKNFNIRKVAKNEQFILTITINGYGKRTSGYEYRVTNRNSQGVLNIDTHQRNGSVVSSFSVENDDHIMLMTDMGTVIRTEVNNIRVTSRNAKGVKIINLKKGEKVVSVSKICTHGNE